MAMLVYLRVFILLLMSLRVMALVQPSQPGVTPFMPPVVTRGIFAQVGTRWCPRCLAITWMVLKSEITLDFDQFSSLFLRDISPNGFRCLFVDAFIEFSIYKTKITVLWIYIFGHHTEKKTAKSFGVVDQSLASSPIQHHSVAFASANAKAEREVKNGEMSVPTKAIACLCSNQRLDLSHNLERLIPSWKSNWLVLSHVIPQLKLPQKGWANLSNPMN